ncbi:MAG: hypothetical protein AAGA16_06245 [Cyanobacteria bacterium P01_E01_bin.35]
MNSNPRPIFCFDPNPILAWNKVPGALSYEFTLINQATSEELWSTEVSNPQCDDNETCQCDYPLEKQFLEPLVSYLLIAKAKKETEYLQEFQSEVILLEAEEQQIYHDFEDLLYSEKESDQKIELLQMWNQKVIKIFGNGDRPPSIRPPRLSYIGLSFL